jgi:hypothetical protein
MPPVALQLLPNITDFRHSFVPLRDAWLTFHPLMLDKDHLPLYEYGCSYQGEINCTRTCFNNSAALWGDLATLSNCLMYPVVSIWLTNDMLDEESVAIAKDLGISDSRDVDLSHLISPINDCITEYHLQHRKDAWAFFSAEGLPLKYATSGWGSVLSSPVWSTVSWPSISYQLCYSFTRTDHQF